MQVVTRRLFHDLKEDVIRFEGVVFEVSEERFLEIDHKLPGFVEPLTEEEGTKKKPSRRKKAVADDGEA